ncbi:SDR family oxidoreductase [Nocardioides jejuensis]|uniref:NAD-dependent epimerase/dehydratase family protein n=1 Tax=Nocardioides jejuensis TaxID=2502782 RepID=A0A4R1CB89_9ACTN|nr:NAD-dependent epimerase/dehydratase family protein [Nocardioides jejuensis]TCJ28343.1 NAD-dependent epimerase/dehydratase family protein [Nocardioides jejuensis]
MRVAVAGGTGLVGAKVADRLRAQGHEAVVLTRGEGVDLTTGSGLAAALAGVDAIIDATSLESTKPADTVAFFSAVAGHLQREGAAAGVRRIVTLSIVGIDGLGGGPFGHYDGKRAQEETTEAGEVPTAILRATQFHGFAGQLIDWMAKGPLLPCPTQPVQTVDVDAVADELVALALESPADQHVRKDVAGPDKRLLADLARAIATARGRRLWVLPVWLPGDTARRVRQGILQAPPAAKIIGGTFEEWLAREYPVG